MIITSTFSKLSNQHNERWIHDDFLLQKIDSRPYLIDMRGNPPIKYEVTWVTFMPVFLSPDEVGHQPPLRLIYKSSAIPLLIFFQPFHLHILQFPCSYHGRRRL